MTVHAPQYIQGLGTTAKDDRGLIADLVSAGVVPGGLSVTTTGVASRTSQATSGIAYIDGTQNPNQGVYRLFSDANEVKTHEPAVSYPRWDIIVARVYDKLENGGVGPNQGTIEIVKGVENAAAKVGNFAGRAEELPANSERLASVLVPVGASPAIPAENVIDERSFYSLVAPASSAKSIISTEQALAETVFASLTTPDSVTITLPKDGLIALAYQAGWISSVAKAAQAAIFLGANQLKIFDAPSGAVVTQAARHGGTLESLLSTSGFGLVGNVQSGTAIPVTTGQIVGAGGNVYWEAGASPREGSWGEGGYGGTCYIFAAAGTYTISVKFKVTSGLVTVKNRKLWAWVVA